ncbi:MAG: tRNA-(ms[2]io[6]A)-hydroxylase [Gammaproteobacteria bacterium]
MTASYVPEAIANFLGSDTPASWVQAALGDLPGLINDHANCEKKAAATALSIVFKYPNRSNLASRMSKIAREELRHFEQVQTMMRKTDIAWRRLSASRYASGLHNYISKSEPQKLVDLLIVGAFIEARSCERFALVAPYLESGLGAFYRGLLAAESRHFRVYLELARQNGGHLSSQEFEDRVDYFREKENHLIDSPDPELRFHSGVPQ